MPFADIAAEPGYTVSDQGEVRSPNRVLSPWTLKSGARAVKIRGKTYLVHLLVLQSFVGPRPDGFEVKWLNGNPSDNRLTNLQWFDPDSTEVRTVVNRCSRGHVYSRANTKTWGTGHRICLDCERGVPANTTLPEVL